MKFTVSGHGRKVGAIGIFHGFSCTVEATDEADARIRVYDQYEHISNMHVRKEVTLKFLVRGSRTWNTAWDQLRQKFGDIECRNETYMETWQYMGTVIHEDGPHVGEAEHQFRHRALPGTNERTYWSTYSDINNQDYQT